MQPKVVRVGQTIVGQVGGGRPNVVRLGVPGTMEVDFEGVQMSLAQARNSPQKTAYEQISRTYSYGALPRSAPSNFPRSSAEQIVEPSPGSPSRCATNQLTEKVPRRSCLGSGPGQLRGVVVVSSELGVVEPRADVGRGVLLVVALLRADANVAHGAPSGVG